VRYLETIDDNIVTFGIGPAGTGKTYLAMFQALTYHWDKKNTDIRRIILTRPIVEAGERLGFLPGLLEDKMDPYMRPLYDSLYEMVGIQDGKSKITNGTIEIAPIAFMRGRTFTDAFIIVDEAQNCTYEQLKMVLTRLGENTKMVISGDISQSDLNGKSGLGRMVDAVEGTDNVGMTRFGSQDVVRSEIVRDILTSIEKYER
jgi:phosphate starvation-inducible PhoH-like protein